MKFVNLRLAHASYNKRKMVKEDEIEMEDDDVSLVETDGEDPYKRELLPLEKLKKPSLGVFWFSS